MTIFSRPGSRNFSFLLGIAFVASMLLAIPRVYAAEDDLKYEREVAKGINDFAIDMYLELAKSNDGNILFSPYSLYTTLAMAYAGASDENAKEMAKVVHFGPNVHKGMGLLKKHIESNSYSGARVWAANAIWPVKRTGGKLKKPFEETIKKDYSAQIQTLNFVQNPNDARIAINKWVEIKTSNRIKDLIPPGGTNSSTSIVLTSATYFIGEWEASFLEAETRIVPFFEEDATRPKRKTHVELMSRKTWIPYYETNQAQVICLPYPDREYGMVFILPRKQFGLLVYEKTLQGGAIEELIQKVRYRQATSAAYINVCIPKFQTEGWFTLGSTLRNLGMQKAFVGNAYDKMFFSEKPGQPFNAQLSEIYHKASLRLDGDKTTLDKATRLRNVSSGGGNQPLPEPEVFRADRPFIYLLVHQPTGTIVLMGRLVKPE